MNSCKVKATSTGVVCEKCRHKVNSAESMICMSSRREKQSKAHYHMNERGVLVKCYHACKSVIADLSFWVGVTVSFPLEHWLWEKIWPFTELTKFLGL